LREEVAWQADQVSEVLQRRIDVLEERVSLYRSLRHKIKNVLVDVRRLDHLKEISFGYAVTNINETKEKIECQLGESLFQLFDYAYLDYAQVVSPLSDSEQMTLKDIQMVLLNYFSATDKVLLKYGNALSKSLEAFRLRLREAKGELDKTMLDQWLERGEPGRGQVWRMHHPDATLSEDQVALLAQADTEFAELLANKVPSFKSRYTNKHFRMMSLWQQVKGALEKEDVDRLSALADYLVEQTEDEDLSALGHYARMGLASLAQDWQVVIDHGEKVEHDNLRIPSLKLKLKAYLAMNQAEQAFAVLEALIQYVPEYMMQYATLAMMMGKQEAAVEAVQAQVLKAGADAYTARQAWQWAQANQAQALIDWLSEYMQKIMPELFSQLIT
jgi:hypothetical protein